MQWGRGGLRAHLTGPSPACLHRPSVVEWTTTSTRAVTMAILGSTYSICQMAVGGLAFTLQDWRTLQLAVSVPFFVVFPISWSVQCGAFSLGEKREGNPRGCPSPLPFWLAMAPKMPRPWKRVMWSDPTGRDVEAQSFGVGISARGPRLPPAQPAGPGLRAPSFTHTDTSSPHPPASLLHSTCPACRHPSQALDMESYYRYYF